jgi:hypothetical protein
MLYLPIRKLKTYLIILLAVFCFHLLLNSNKQYSYFDNQLGISNATEEQYQIYLSSSPSIKGKKEIIEGSEIKYLYIFPEQVFIFIYISYFLIITMIILAAKYEPNEYERKIT